jgi:formamidopyrimidine-DNA glycosylase
MLKPLLLDQSFLAGLGNIYVDESLHRARLHPLRSSDTVTRKSALLLADSIHDVLGAAIAAQGSSFDAFYRTPEGKPGSFQDAFRVYDRQGQPCTRCGGTILKIVVGQRGTHLCPRCQRAPRRRAARAR